VKTVVMSLTFLYPLFWLGALAVAVPVWLHLRRKRTTKLVSFSALRFLEDQPEPRRSPLRLRDVLLLALRVTALLLLVSAFSWPYRREPVPEMATESLVYILDNTLSHQAGDGFGRDVKTLRDELARLGKETQAAVVELTAQPRVLSGFGDDRATAARKVGELKPSHQRGSYLAAFRTASTLLAHSLGQKKKIVLLSDSQENQWTEHAGAPPFLQDVEVVLPEVREVAAPNLSLSRPRVQWVLLGDKALIDFAVDLDHLGPAEVATLTLRANGREILRRDVALVNEPGTLTLGTQWETDPQPGIEGEVTIAGTPDVLEADNRVVFALPPVTPGTVVLLAESPYLRTALAPEVLRGRWAARVVEPSQIAAEFDAQNDGDVMCVESHYLQSHKARDLVLRYLQSGRGVLLLLDRDSPLVRGFLRELGFELRGDVAEKTAFRYVLGDHPIFHPFLSPDFGNLMDVSVSRHRKVKAVQALPLVFAEGGDVLFFQGATTRGKLFVGTFGCDRKETDWPVHPTFLPFLDLCLQNARARDELPNDFEPGELAVLSLPGDRPSGEVILRKGDRELSREPVKNSRVQVRMPDEPGLYTLIGVGAPGEERTLSVNPAAQEAQLTYLKAPALVPLWQLDPARAAKARSKIIPAELSRASILQQHWWWWLLLCGLAAFLGESAWLAARREQS
jgi:Aerotolerance regulator N-terminal/von Willebrand factor type A domain